MPVSKKALFRYKILNSFLQSRKGYSIKELTDLVNEEMGKLEEPGQASKTVSDRMIRIDIENMQSIFPVVIGKRDGNKYYYEDSSDSIDNINISEQDKTAISLAVGVFSRFKGTPIYDKFSDAVTRIMANSVIRKINTSDTRNIVQVAEVNENSGVEWLETIYNAIVEKKTLKLEYKNFGKKTSIRVISPYMLKEYRNKWYMIAYVHGLDKPDKTLLHKLSRIIDIQPADDKYEEDPTFNGNKYFKYTLGVFHKHAEEPIDVKLKLKEKSIITLFSEDKVHPTQELIPISEDEATLEMRVYNSPELETFILGYAEAIEVVEPLELRDKILDRIGKLIRIYNM
jgi:predicted DNA-binding transcriptional regulator YafY